MSTLRRLALITTIATLILVSVGGFVRAAGAGLGCPEWPKCFGRWYPPTDVSQLPAHIPAERFNFKLAWIEYINRLIGVVIGLLVTATWVQALRVARNRSGIIWSLTAAWLLTGFQGWFGGQVVKYELDPRLVTIHLVVALVIVGLLLYAAFATMTRRRPLEGLGRLPLLGQLSLGLSLVQVVVGALVRGEIDLVGKAQPDLARGDRLAEVGWVDPIHRELALLLSIMVLWQWWRARALKERRPWVSRLATIALVCLLIQVAAGLGLAYGPLPPALQVVHISAATWLASALFLFLLALRRESLD